MIGLPFRAESEVVLSATHAKSCVDGLSPRGSAWVRLGSDPEAPESGSQFRTTTSRSSEQREWGDPRASSALFNPKSLDTDQWAHAARSAGMAYGCLTTKHHDGFCLWTTATGSARVKEATYKRDIVRAYVDSFRSQGLKTCLYFSILDLRGDIRPYYVTRGALDRVKAQLTELLISH